jgi:hypothetical protein
MYLAEIETRVSGIPCRIGVEEWPSEDDGGCWTVLDRRGRPAPWLARKATERDDDRMRDAIDCYLAGERQDAEEARAELRWYARHGY